MRKLLIAALLLSGCSHYRPLVDSQGVDMNRYEADLRDCQGYAQQVAGAGTNAAVGAAVGAGLSYALSRILGGNTNAGIKAGALIGGASGGAAGAESEMNVIRRCMSGRGYRVLQ